MALHSRLLENTPARCSKDLIYYAKYLGGDSDRVTPVPIPNTVVKPVNVDGTAPERVWESSKPPGLNKKPSSHFVVGVFVVVLFVIVILKSMNSLVFRNENRTPYTYNYRMGGRNRYLCQ